MGLANSYLTQLSRVIENVDGAALDSVIDLFLAARQRGALIFVVGNGGSASTASHMVCDINKLTIRPNRQRFKTISLSDNVPSLTAWGNDSSYDDVFVEQLRHFLSGDDIVVGITTSGNSPNIVKAMAYAKDEGATTVLFGGEDGGQCLALADYAVLTPTAHQGMQEDCHLIFNHVIANSIREVLEAEDEQPTVVLNGYRNGKNGTNGTNGTNGVNGTNGKVHTS